MPDLSKKNLQLPADAGAALEAAGKKIEEIRKLDLRERETEYLLLLKGLAAWHYPDAAGASAVRTLVDAMSKWPERFHVSLAQLKLHLEAMFSPAELSRSRLYRRLGEIFAAEQVPHPGIDVPFHALQPLASAEELAPVEMTRYATLLEAACRKAGPGKESGAGGKGTAPFYRLEDGSWRLVFPAGFLEGILKRCLESLEELRAAGEGK